MFADYAVKGDIPFRHAVGLNADCDLFYANPWVIAITEEDRAHPLVFFLRLEADFGIRVPWIIASRQLVLDPTSAGVGALPFAAVAAVSGGESAATHRGKRTTSQSRLFQGFDGQRCLWHVLGPVEAPDFTAKRFLTVGEAFEHLDSFAATSHPELALSGLTPRVTRVTSTATLVNGSTLSHVLQYATHTA